MKWEKFKLSSLIEKPISGEWGDGEGSIRVIRSTNFTNDGTLNLSDVVLRDIQQSKVEKKKLKKGDVIIEKSGGSPTQPVGRVVHFLEENQQYLCNNFTSVLRPKSNVNARYLFWCLFSGHINGSTLKFQNKTTGIINLQLERYCNEFEVSLPPLHIQEQIADTLDKADALRRKDQELLQKYDQLAQAIFYDMFGDPVRNEKGWPLKTIQQLVTNSRHSIKRGPFGGALKKEIFVEKGYLVFEQYHALNNDFSFERYYITQEKYEELIAFNVEPGDIIISCSGIYLGKLAIVPKGVKKGIINQALLKVTLDQSFYKNDFFTTVFSHPNFKEKYFASERGAAIPNFPPMSVFKEFKFIYPPIALQEKYMHITKHIKAATTNLKNKPLLFETLMNKYFS